MADLSLESVSKTFGRGIVAVRDLDLRVADGEFVVLVGPSGCGKTTTLRLIAGLEDATSGTIRIGGRVVDRVHPKDRDIAMVFQDYALYPHMTVRKNLSFALKLRKTPRDEIARRVHDTARMLGIESLLDRRPSELSGGQQQRVAVGRAVVRSPQCYLLDEPLSNLDARLRLQMRAELKALHRRLRTTTIYVTHDQEEAMTLGDRLVVMYGGEIQQVGLPLDVYREPANRFVAGFLGSPPMNFIEGRVEGGRFVDGAGVVFDLPSGIAAALGDGAAVVAGLRPEQLRPRGAARDGDPGVALAEIEVEVEVLEPFGDRMDVVGRTTGGQPIVARIDSSVALEPGERAVFGLDPAGVHLFERGPLGRRVSGG